MMDTASAMTAFGNGLNVTAHNIANSLTRSYEALSRHYGSDNGSNLPALLVRDGGGPVDYAREITNLSIDQRAFEANAAVFKTWQDLNQSLLDMLI